METFIYFFFVNDAMIDVSIDFDYLTSLLISHHVINAPSQLTAMFNPELLKRLEVIPNDRANYLSFWRGQGYREDQMDNVRTQLFKPEASNLEEYLSLQSSWPDELRVSLRRFDSRFKPYSEEVKQRIDDKIGERLFQTQEIADKVYDVAQRLIGFEMKKPGKLDIRVIEGYAPSGQGYESEGIDYVLVNSKNFLESDDIGYYLTLIHEMVGHAPCADTFDYHSEIFGQYEYEVEEGFAKAFTQKVADEVLEQKLPNYPSGGLETLAFHIFNKNWHSLKYQGFRQWYKDCMYEIRQSCQY
jgi:hypothetical protein